MRSNSRTARRVWWVLSSWVLGWLLVPLAWRVWQLVTLYFYVGLPLYLCSWIWAFFVMLRLRRTLKVELQEWWLDLEARDRLIPEGAVMRAQIETG